jgi:hypothetical protein
MQHVIPLSLAVVDQACCHCCADDDEDTGLLPAAVPAPTPAPEAPRAAAPAPAPARPAPAAPAAAGGRVPGAGTVSVPAAAAALPLAKEAIRSSARPAADGGLDLLVVRKPSGGWSQRCCQSLELVVRPGAGQGAYEVVSVTRWAVELALVRIAVSDWWHAADRVCVVVCVAVL